MENAFVGAMDQINRHPLLIGVALLGVTIRSSLWTGGSVSYVNMNGHAAPTPYAGNGYPGETSWKTALVEGLIFVSALLILLTPFQQLLQRGLLPARNEGQGEGEQIERREEDDAQMRQTNQSQHGTQTEVLVPATLSHLAAAQVVYLPATTPVSQPDPTRRRQTDANPRQPPVGTPPVSANTARGGSLPSVPRHTEEHTQQEAASSVARVGSPATVGLIPPASTEAKQRSNCPTRRSESQSDAGHKSLLPLSQNASSTVTKKGARTKRGQARQGFQTQNKNRHKIPNKTRGTGIDNDATIPKRYWVEGEDACQSKERFSESVQETETTHCRRNEVVQPTLNVPSLQANSQSRRARSTRQVTRSRPKVPKQNHREKPVSPLSPRQAHATPQEYISRNQVQRANGDRQFFSIPTHMPSQTVPPDFHLSGRRLRECLTGREPGNQHPCSRIDRSSYSYANGTRSNQGDFLHNNFNPSVPILGPSNHSPQMIPFQGLPPGNFNPSAYPRYIPVPIPENSPHLPYRHFAAHQWHSESLPY